MQRNCSLISRKWLKKHNAVSMKTSDIDPCDFKAVCFFKSMGYGFIPRDDKFLEGTKDLSKEAVHNLVQWLDDHEDKLFRRNDVLRGWISLTLVSLIAIFVFIYIITAIQIFVFRNASPLDTSTVVLSLLAVFFSFFSFLAQIGDRQLIQIRYGQALKLRKKLKQEPFSITDKLILKSLIKIRNMNGDVKLGEVFDNCETMFSKEDLIQQLYGSATAPN